MAKQSYWRRLYMAFLRGLSANTLSLIGVILTTSSFLLFILFEFSIATGWVDNAYLGLISYMALPAMFIFGLILIPWGWHLYSKKRGRPFMDLFEEQFSDADLRAKTTGARVVRFFVLLTVINVIFLGVVGTTTLHFMDTSHFCGTACHTVMNPEWTTYQESPHAHVACVECHVGEGADAMINAKLNGAWQVISATFDLYEKPIPTPVHTLRPARETCEECHWPAKFHGNRVLSRVHYQEDEESTPRYTALVMKTGTGSEGNPTGSHWHIADRNTVRYASINDERETMIWVDVLQADGSWKRFHNTTLPDTLHEEVEDVRVMDCVDCHNRATHIYEEPDFAVDERISRGLIPSELPYVKREVLKAITAEYPSKPEAIKQIGQRLRAFYTQEYPDRVMRRSSELEKTVDVAQAIYERNIHPEMDIDWGAYPSHLGHQNDSGCFRCHNFDMLADDGAEIPMDCDLCHSIIADGDRTPPEFLEY